MTVKETPTRGLRAVFARFRGKGGAAQAGAAAEKKAADKPAGTAKRASDAVGQGGNVKVVAPEGTEAVEVTVPEVTASEVTAPDVAASEVTVPEAAAPEAVEPSAAEPEAVSTEPEAAATEAAAPVVATQEAAAPQEAVATEEAALPVPRYDTLTVASLRARLRTLNPGQLTILIDYEKAHQGREEVIGMFERRIVKIKAGETTSFQAIG
jgi:hypothetical protein